MLGTSEIRVSGVYGILGGIVSFLYGIALYFLYNQNPYSEQTEISSTIIFVPVFVFLGVQYFKKYIDPELTFSKAFKVAVLLVVFLAGTVAVLQLLYTLIFGEVLIAQFIIDAKAELVKSKADLIKSIGAENYNMMLREVSDRSALSLSLKQMTLRMLVGILVGVVSAVFFRK